MVQRVIERTQGKTAVYALVTDQNAITCSDVDQVVIEALTTKAAELILCGLNEADRGRPVVFDLWRVSQGVTKPLMLINNGFDALQIDGEVLQGSTKSGTGISRHMRTIQR